MSDILNIRDLNHEGEGVANKEGYTLFVDGALPNEVVEASLFFRKKHFGRARLKKILTPSIDRIDPPCPYFGTCGGCQMMHLNYEKQLEFKTKRVEESLKRVGKITTTVHPCVASPKQLAYRNKIQLPAREEGIGLYKKNSNDLVAIDACKIHCSLGEKAFCAVKEIILRKKIPPYHPETGTGELRHILIKSAVQTKEVLVIFVTNGEPTKNLKEAAIEIMEQDPSIKGIVHNKQTERSNVILGRKTSLLCGEGFIKEKLLDLVFKVSPASFFQVNPAQAENLYRRCVELSDLKGDEIVLDAFCGVGTLSLFFARGAKKVIGVECVEEAIRDAKENARMNGIQNVEFHTALAERFMKSLLHIDIVLLNPPRKGCDPAVLDALERLKPKKILYISCDPATLARDLSKLVEFGYSLKEVQPYDMFPQTAHVETLVYIIYQN